MLAIDQAESGRLAGSAIGKFSCDRWDCAANAYVSLESNDGDPDGRARMQGFRDGYQEACELPDALHVLDDADRVATAETQVAQLLKDLKGGRNVVVGLNEDAILGAIAAADSADRSGDLWYAGQLADPSIREHIACDEQYVASVAQFPERFGGLLIPAIIDALDGREVPDLIDAPLALVDAGNIRELYPATPVCGG